MLVKFKESGESPDIGIFIKGEERTIAADLAEIFRKRGLIEDAKPARAAKPQEVKGHGGE